MNLKISSDLVFSCSAHADDAEPPDAAGLSWFSCVFVQRIRCQGLLQMQQAMGGAGMGGAGMGGMGALPGGGMGALPGAPAPGAGAGAPGTAPGTTPPAATPGFDANAMQQAMQAVSGMGASHSWNCMSDDLIC